MGQRGPAPKPTALKQLAGNPGKRPLNDAEPQPDNTLPTCPRWLPKEAKAEWGRLAKQLHNAGLLTGIDRNALAAYCVAFARWKAAEQMVEKSSQVVKSKNTESFYLNPWLNAASMALKEMVKLAAEFGMTPSARSRIRVEKAEQEESLADLLFRGSGSD